MTETSTEPFALPHDVEAIFDSLKLSIEDPALKRRISNAIAQLVENNRAIEDRATQSVGLLPIYTTDPPVLVDGMTWINATAGKVRARVNGSTVDLN